MASSSSSDDKRSENELGRKWDRCIADSLLKTSAGLAIGVVASFALFKGRTFPIWLGTGVGIGMAMSNCRHDLDAPFVLHGRKVPVEEVVGGKTQKSYKIVMEPPPSASSPPTPTQKQSATTTIKT